MMASFRNVRDFSSAISYALEKLAVPDLILKEEQRLSIQAVYDGKDVFVWLSTGFGKSICYHALPFAMDYKLNRIASENSSAVLVVSPLLALMVDQVRGLRSKGVKSSVLTSISGDMPKSLLVTFGLLRKTIVLSSPVQT